MGTHYIIRNIERPDWAWHGSCWTEHRGQWIRYERLADAWSVAKGISSPCRVVKVTTKPKQKTITPERLYEVYRRYAALIGMRTDSYQSFIGQADVCNRWIEVAEMFGHKVVP